MDYQPIVDEIRSFVQSVDQTLTDRIKDVAVLYAQACNEVNQRLRRCEEFLQKGLRSEAIHLAQTEPVLLDQLAILDFAERPQWDELAMMYGLPSAPQLRVQTATALNEAYSDEQPLEELLRKHRFLALTRGSLRGRLSIMRRIAELDPASTVWGDDIRSFEKQRFQQIQSDLAGLARREDYEQLAAIATEMQSTVWLSAPPGTLVKQVESTKNRFRKAWASNALRNLEAELSDAINVFDIPRARQVRDKWGLIARDAELAENDPILQRASRSFEWLKNQDIKEANERAFQDNLDELENAVEKAAPRAVVDQVYHSVMQYGRGIPAVLESRYRAYLAEQEKKRNRKRNLITMVTATGALLVIAIISWSVYQSYQTKKLDDAKASLENMSAADKIKEAREFFDKLPEETKIQPEILQLEKELVRREKNEQERERKFWKAFKEAEDELVEVIESPAVKRAESLAKKNREWITLEELVEKRRQRKRQDESQTRQTFQDRIRDEEKLIQNLEDLVRRGKYPEAQTLLNKLQQDTPQLEVEAKKYGLLGQVDALAPRLEIARGRLTRNQVQVDLESKLSVTLAQPNGFESYVDALRTYRKEFPDDQRSADFEQVLKEKSLWKGILEWTEFASSLPEGPFFLLPEEAKATAASCRTFLKDHSDCVNFEIADTCVKSLDAVAQRNERVPGSAASDLHNLFEDFLIKDLWIIKMKGNKAYYSREKVDFSDKAESISFQRLVGFDGKKEGTTVIGKNVEGVYRAPQSVLAEQKVRKLLPIGYREKTWNETTIKIAQMIIDDTETDAILKLVLVKKIVDYAGRGSYPLWLALGEQRDYLEKIKLNLELPWMNPEDEGAKEGREKAAEMLGKMPSLKSAPEKAVSAQQKIIQQVKESKKELMGWLARSDSGWECRSSTSTPKGQLVLFVLMREQGAILWKKVGTLEAGKFKIPETPDVLLEGRLVFGQSSTTP
jgi:hypothetical protein